jgi:hypothetical protein
MKSRWIAVLSILLTHSAGAAVFAYDESILGDLSDDYLIPHVFTPGTGTSTLTGSVADGDRDLFTIDIAAGLQLTSLFLVSYTTTDPDRPDNITYLLAQPGATLAAAPSNEDPYPGGAIGYVGFGKWAEGRELLRFLTAGPPFDYATTLGPGSYAFWINETGPVSGYQFRFQVAAVPEPSIPMLAAVAGLLLVRRKRASAI